MGISRYGLGNTLGDGKTVASSSNMSKITAAVEAGNVFCSTYIIEEGERLDHVAGNAYGNSSYWWVIAAASNIGWGLQVPPGTLLKIPTDLNKIIETIL
jgi:nucleoid-associated protein YgaU